MKLFFKHILRSIRGRPAQPIILILTLSLSLAVSSIILSIKSAIFNETMTEFSEKYGHSDIIVSVDSNSTSRFIFADDVEQLFGDNGTVAGYYELLLSGGDDIILGAAADFSTVGNIFDISFTEYGKITEDNLSESVILYSDFAKRHSLSVGDEFSTTLFGKNVTYTVEGITTTPPLGGHDVLLDISGVMKLLASDSVFAAVIGDDFKPCSKLYIALADGVDAEWAMDSLCASEKFSDKSITATPRAGNVKVLDLIITFAVVLSFIMTTVVSFSSFSILQRQRKLESDAFSIAGAPRRMLNFMQYAEALIYWFFGTFFGLLLSLPINALANLYANLRFVRIELTPLNMLISSGALFLSLFLTVTLFIHFGSTVQKRAGKLLIPIVGSLAAVCYILQFLLPMNLRFGFGLATMLLVFLLVFLSAAKIICALIRKIGAKMEKAPKKLSLYYAVKNLFSVGALHNTMRLTALLVAALSCVFSVIWSLRGNAKLMENAFDTEYVVLNGTSRCYDKIEGCSGVSSVERAYITTYAHKDSYHTSVVSVSDISVFSDDIPITKQPKGNEAVISYAEAKMLSLEVGDSFEMDISGVPSTLEVIEIVKTGFNFVLIDCENFGINYSIMLPILAPSANEAEFIGEVTAITADEIATVTKTETLLENRVKGFGIYTRCGDLLLLVVLVFALIGLIDTTLESYNVRAGEFSLYRVGGMSGRAAAKLKAYEILLTTLCGIGVGLIGYFLVFPIVIESMYGIGYEFVRNLLMLF